MLALITRRLEVTDEPHEIQKLFWEQARALREKGDQEGALRALEHVTMLDPDHVGALALLGEINIRRANFEAAATSLARLAVLDTAPAKSRLTAGVAAVDLYENKLDRYDKALEVLLGLHRARLSSLPVRERLARAAARTGSWKEATAILEELMHERSESDGRIEAARLAMAIHRDRLGQPHGAAAAIVKLLEESPMDGEALDMFLQTDHPKDVRDRYSSATPARLSSRRSSSALGRRMSPSVRRLVKVARALGVDDALRRRRSAPSSRWARGMPWPSRRSPSSRAGRRGRRRSPSATPRCDPSCSAGGRGADRGALLDARGRRSRRRWGRTSRRAASPAGTRSTRGAAWRCATRSRRGPGAFGARSRARARARARAEFDLYVGGKDTQGVQGIPGETPALVVGSGINTPLGAAARARVARELLAMVRGTTVARSRDDLTFAAVVVAASRQAEVQVESPPYAMMAEVEKLLGKAIARKTRKAIADVCRSIVRAGADARGLEQKRALASHDRVGAVASGDVSAVVLAEVLGAPPDKLGAAVKGNARAEELLRFVLSPQYLEIRRSLGLEGGS